MSFALAQNIIINEIKIQNDLNGFIELIESQDRNNAYIAFDSIIFNEDINEPAMSGSLNIVDANNFLDKLNLRAGNKIIVDITFLEPIANAETEDQYEKKDYNLEFDIIDIISTTDLANQKTTGGYGSPVKTIIRFSSPFFTYINYEISDFWNGQETPDFLGTISNENNGKFVSETIPESKNITITCNKVESSTNVGTEEEPLYLKRTYYTTTSDWGLAKPRSFVNMLFDKIISFYLNGSPTNLKNINTHSTSNDVWFRLQNFNYPNFKFAKLPTLLNFLNYIKEYAILYEPANRNSDVEPSGVNKTPKVDFMFWETLDSWNFKSINKMVQEQEELWKSNRAPVYFPTPKENSMGAIISMEILQESNFAQLYSEGAYASEYVHVKPNWDNPYRKALSSDEEFVKRLIRYSYTSDIFEPNDNKPIIARNTGDNKNNGESIFSENERNYIRKGSTADYSTHTQTDLNFGYFNKHTYNSNKNVWWEYLDTAPYRYTYNGYYDNPSIGVTYLDEKFNYSIIRRGQEYWQSQFDFCELPGSGLYKILYDVKDKKIENRKNYFKAKQLKEKWKFYKERICCERQIPTTFFALLTKAEKIYGGNMNPSEMYAGKDITGKTFADDPGGIYAYDWVEVEFWPRSDVTSILETGEEIIKFDNNELFPFVFVKPRNALQGHGIIEKEYKPVQRSEEDPNYMNTPEEDEVPAETLNKHSQEGIKYFTKNTRAYNLNEILNTSGITLQKKDRTGSILTSILQKCKTLITNPGISMKLKGSDADACLSTYPSQFNMMPVGHFRIISNCQNKENWKFGRIVQMTTIPKEIMQTMTKFQDGITLDSTLSYSGRNTTIRVDLATSKTVEFETRKKIVEDLKPETPGGYQGSTTDPSNPPQYFTPLPWQQFFNQHPYLFVFDVENAHDGLCDNACTVP